MNGFDQVFVMLSSGVDPLQLTTDSADKKVDSFSIDGTGIFYDNIQGNEVWSVPTLGGPPTRIVSGQTLITSPDGNSFYYLKPGSSKPPPKGQIRRRGRVPLTFY